MEFYVVAFWLILCIVSGRLGHFRTIGFWETFAISMLLSPVVGIMFVFNAKRKDTVKYEKMLLEQSKYMLMCLKSDKNEIIDDADI